MIKKSAERFFGLIRLDEIIRDAGRRRAPGSIWGRLAKVMDLRLDVRPDDRRKVPRSGPVVVVANHPSGGAEAILLAAWLDGIRPDVMILGHRWFERYPALAKKMILVEPQNGPGVRRRNAAALAKARSHLGRGGLIVVFPAGTVARWDWRRRAIVDPPWRSGVAHLLRKTAASVVPVCLQARNGWSYQIASAIHPRLGALLLGRELLAKRGTSVRLHVGSKIPFDQAWRLEPARDVCRKLRRAVDSLGDEPMTASVPGAVRRFHLVKREIA